jgi:hypothetical protein
MFDKTVGHFAEVSATCWKNIKHDELNLLKKNKGTLVLGNFRQLAVLSTILKDLILHGLILPSLTDENDRV